MLVVRVELWPDGHADQAQPLAIAGFANISDLAPTSDYAVVFVASTGPVSRCVVTGHNRPHGPWALLAAALAAPPPAFLTEDLEATMVMIEERLTSEA